MPLPSISLSDLGPEVVVDDTGGSAPSTGADKHTDVNYPPKLTAIDPAASVAFDTDSLNVAQKPSDATMKVKLVLSGAVGANTTMFNVAFGSSYRNRQEQDCPPIVIGIDETINLTAGIKVLNVTHVGFSVRSDFGAVAGTYYLRFVTVPTAS